MKAKKRQPEESENHICGLCNKQHRLFWPCDMGDVPASDVMSQSQADNLQRRRYAEAALTGLLANTDRRGLLASYARDAFKCADAMLAEQHRCESARGSE